LAATRRFFQSGK